jgi:hypothetical protein
LILLIIVGGSYWIRTNDNRIKSEVKSINYNKSQQTIINKSIA